MAQLVVQLFPTLEIRSSNPDIDLILSTNCTSEKTKLKKSRPGMAQLKKNIVHFEQQANRGRGKYRRERRCSRVEFASFKVSQKDRSRKRRVLQTYIDINPACRCPCPSNIDMRGYTSVNYSPRARAMHKHEVSRTTNPKKVMSLKTIK